VKETGGKVKNRKLMRRQTPFGELEIFDAHTHFFSHNFFSMLAKQSPVLKGETNPVKKIGEMTGLQMPPESPRDLAKIWVDELDKSNVARVLLMASLPNDENSVAEAVAAFPDRIFGGFFFNPLQEDAVKRAKRGFDELHLKMICLFPAMHRFSVADDENVRAIVGLVRKRKGTVIFVHCGALSIGIRGKIGLKSEFDLRYSDPLEVHKLASEFPDVNFIIPHFGAGFWRETLMAAELCPNIYLDTSGSNRWTKYEATDLDLSKVFEKTLAVVGAKRLLFGTDSSFFPRGWNAEIFDAQVKVMSELGVEKADAELIFGGNLRRLLLV
jgi:predicted TIM-barrel fold metal-dependent hydrolase